MCSKEIDIEKAVFIGGQEAFGDKFQIWNAQDCSSSRTARQTVRQRAYQRVYRQHGVTRTMNLDNVLPLPLDCSDYVTTSAKLILDNDDITQKQLLKQMQNVCIVYACLAVKRNAGIVGTDAKHAAAATGYKEIAVPGFLRWARDEGLQLPTWLTVDRMGCTTLVGGEIRRRDTHM